MQSYEVLQKAIPEQQSPKVAKFLGVVASYVNRWRRRPADDDEPNGTGQRSPLDRICDLIDIIFLINPQDTGLVVQFIVNHWRRLLRTHSKPLTCQQQIADTVEELLDQTIEAVNEINKNGPTPEALRQLVQMRDSAQTAIDSVQATIDGKETQPK